LIKPTSLLFSSHPSFTTSLEIDLTAFVFIFTVILNYNRQVCQETFIAQQTGIPAEKHTWTEIRKLDFVTVLKWGTLLANLPPILLAKSSSSLMMTLFLFFFLTYCPYLKKRKEKLACVSTLVAGSLCISLCPFICL
jgi:hypothetical protein